MLFITHLYHNDYFVCFVLFKVYTYKSYLIILVVYSLNYFILKNHIVSYEWKFSYFINSAIFSTFSLATKKNTNIYKNLNFLKQNFMLAFFFWFENEVPYSYLYIYKCLESFWSLCASKDRYIDT